MARPPIRHVILRPATATVGEERPAAAQGHLAHHRRPDHFPLCLSTEHQATGLLDNVSVARGNLLLCDHGRTVVDALPPPNRWKIRGGVLELPLPRGPLTFRPTRPGEPIPDGRRARPGGTTRGLAGAFTRSSCWAGAPPTETEVGRGAEPDRQRRLRHAFRRRRRRRRHRDGSASATTSTAAALIAPTAPSPATARQRTGRATSAATRWSMSSARSI